MRAEAREMCAENRSEPIEPRVIERETFWALCL
jgi:hypothetical protein